MRGAERRACRSGDRRSKPPRYPANFLIDRGGLLHPAPSTDQPFEVLEAEVDRVLALPAGTP